MLDFNKPVQTRDGRKVRVLCTDRKCATGYHNSVVVLVTQVDGSERTMVVTKDGKIMAEDRPTDLVNVPETRCVVLFEYLSMPGQEYALCFRLATKADEWTQTTPGIKVLKMQQVTL